MNSRVIHSFRYAITVVCVSNSLRVFMMVSCHMKSGCFNIYELVLLIQLSHINSLNKILKNIYAVIQLKFVRKEM